MKHIARLGRPLAYLNLDKTSIILFKSDMKFSFRETTRLQINYAFILSFLYCKMMRWVLLQVFIEVHTAPTNPYYQEYNILNINQIITNQMSEYLFINGCQLFQKFCSMPSCKGWHEYKDISYAFFSCTNSTVTLD